MNQSGVIVAGSGPQKAQKGWLSRWTRKQWSRHWFVLKNGSLTYYRGPAAELCSFLDGVLDLSLIKHIEVHREQPERAGSGPGQDSAGQQNPHQHYHYLSQLASLNQQASGPYQHQHQQQAQQQFTFSLKMWNGECHLLAASSPAERNLWLDSISACANGDSLNEDATSTDSSSSSDSSPTSNLSAKSLDIGHCTYESSLIAAALRRCEPTTPVRQLAKPVEQQQETTRADQDAPMLDTDHCLERSRGQLEQGVVDLTTTMKNPSQLKGVQPEVASLSNLDSCQNEQAFKRRLMSVQTRPSSLGDPKLITRNFDPYASLQVTGSGQQDAGCEKEKRPEEGADETEEEDEEEEEEDGVEDDVEEGEEVDEDNDDDQDEEREMDQRDRSGSRAGDEQVAPARVISGKQKKRVTFDLSSLAREACYTSGRNRGSSAESSSASENSSSDSSCSESDSESEPESEVSSVSGQGDDGPDERELRPDADGTTIVELGKPEQESNLGKPNEQLLLAARLDEAQTSIGLLERRLNSSYASYSQLEISYKRLQVDLAASQDQHKFELAQVQARVEELTRELADSERRLAEMRAKLAECEQPRPRPSSIRTPSCTQKPESQKALLNCWLRAGQHHHQPLMLIQHVKQHSAGQQGLGLKLLNQSKQIQRKLNELELKVDQIQGCASAKAELENQPSGVANTPTTTTVYGS